MESRERGSPLWLDRRAAAGVGAALIIAFLGVSLAPCPSRIRVDFSPPASTHECQPPPSSAYLTAPCPCGCDAHPPVAGSSARLGVALLLEAPHFTPLAVVERVLFAALRFEPAFIPPIDHIPLPA